MRILLLTNEYPPNIYGGAGVHVANICREFERPINGRNHLSVLCFGNQKEEGEKRNVTGIPPSEELNGIRPPYGKIMDTLHRNVVMTGTTEKADIVQCHTWYTHLAGCLIKNLHRIPMVITVHSLEPHRPWKKEQLGNGYYVSSWLEKTALLNADGVIAVSHSMKEDIRKLYDVEADRIRVIYNGIEIDKYRKTENPEKVAEWGVNPEKPYLLFVGRITRQKGIIHLVNALEHLDEGIQVVLCAGAPDTDEIADEMKKAVADARARTRNDIVWITQMVPEPDLIVLYSHASVFVCPSVYEPFGIINLEAMACHTPVVASAVGGIPEVVVHGETGFLVPFEPAGVGNAEPKYPRRYAEDLADAVNRLFRSPERLDAMSDASRRHVEAKFSWEAIARQTLGYYKELIATVHP